MLDAAGQDQGAAYVFVDNFGAIATSQALSKSMVSEWEDLFEPVHLALRESEEHVGLGAALGGRPGRPRPPVRAQPRAIMAPGARPGSPACPRAL